MTYYLGSDGMGAEADLQEAARHLARPEARDAHLLLQPPEGLIDRFSELLLVDFDGEFDSIAL
jgi:hypothetical protein